MKRLLLFFCAASLLASTTTITQTVRGPDGNMSNGTLLVRISAACRSGADYVDQRTIAVNFLNGALTINLVPNDSCSPLGTTYAATFMTCASSTSGATLSKPCPTGASQSWGQTWTVPTSTTPITIDMLGGISSPGLLGGDVSGAIGSNLVTGLQGKPLPTIAPTDGQLMQYSASVGKWVYIGVLSASAIPGLTGDVIKNDGSNATTVQAIRNYPVTATAPADGQLYQWSSTAGEWTLISLVEREVLTGTVDGTNAVFTLAHTPVAGSLTIKRNGLEDGPTGCWAISGNTVTFTGVCIPQPEDVMTGKYRY